MFAPRLVTAPDSTPVSLADVKAHLGLGPGAHPHDAEITGYIESVTETLDGWRGWLGRCIVDQTWAQDFEGWPCAYAFGLPFPDCRSAVVTYRDAAHASQTLTASAHSAPLSTPLGGCVFLYSDAVLAALSSRPAPVTVTFTAGFGDQATVPRAIKQAIMLEVGALYAKRGASDVTIKSESVVGVGATEYFAAGEQSGRGNIASVAAERLLAPYRIPRV